VKKKYEPDAENIKRPNEFNSGEMSTGKYPGLVFETIINASRDQLLSASLQIF
jgi:hypothetical protein